MKMLVKFARVQYLNIVILAGGLPNIKYDIQF